MTVRELVGIAQAVSERLRARDLRLTTAESCTGGWIAKVLTDLPGSSHWFERGFVTYSNESKQEMLGVQASTLNAYGAVSEHTAGEMAAGALAFSRADVSVSVTGIAGPGGATPEKPLGMVCIGWASRGSSPITVTRQFDGDREAVRRASVVSALRGVLDLVGD